MSSEFRKNPVLESIWASKLPVHAVALTHEPTGSGGKASLLWLLVSEASPKDQAYLINDSPEICDEASELGFSAIQIKVPRTGAKKPECKRFLVPGAGVLALKGVGVWV